MRNVVRFMTTMQPAPTYVMILFFWSRPGKMARAMNSPPTRPPMCPMASTVESIEKRREMKTMTPMIQARTALTGP